MEYRDIILKYRLELADTATLYRRDTPVGYMLFSREFNKRSRLPVSSMSFYRLSAGRVPLDRGKWAAIRDLSPDGWVKDMAAELLAVGK